MINRTVLTISVPKETARRYRMIAKQKKETISQLFRNIFDAYDKQRIKDEVRELQKYGSKIAKKMKLTEKDIERIVFEDR